MGYKTWLRNEQIKKKTRLSFSDLETRTISVDLLQKLIEFLEKILSSGISDELKIEGKECNTALKKLLLSSMEKLAKTYLNGKEIEEIKLSGGVPDRLKKKIEKSLEGLS